ncbi:MAG: hypothetical protein K2W82_14800 [Candidatus Obscuribacterales bacterium]|nr:hypothetical protein [Candidatus Obscuribacterales bacterium]
MDRTLFTPAMIETFRVCKRAYELAFVRPRTGSERIKLSTVCKRFLLKAFAEVNRGKLTSVNEAQKYIGQHWSALKIGPDAPEELQTKSIQAFRFAYRALTTYVNKPYKPAGSENVGVSVKLRARIPHSNVYLEDTFDMILWHPQEKVLEVVDFHLNPLKPFDPAWPSPSLLVRQFLLEKLRTRLPFEKIKMTFIQIQSQGMLASSCDLDGAVFRLHWPEIINTVEAMKNPADYEPHRSELCKRCDFLSECLSMGGYGNSDNRNEFICRSA